MMTKQSRLEAESKPVSNGSKEQDKDHMKPKPK